MAVTTTTAITSQTAAADSAQISIDMGSSVQVYCTPKLRRGESVGLERSTDGGTTWIPVNDPIFGGRLLSGDINSNVIAGPGVFRLVKSQTDKATAVLYDA